MARKLRKSPRRRSEESAAQPAKVRRRPSWKTTIVCGLLAAMVALAFLTALSMGFLHFDDDIYVWRESHVFTGLSAANWDWAWTHSHARNWHPLTTLSHMLDCQLFGLQRVWGHHLGNLLLHALVAMLIFLVFKAMTGRFWASAAIAALFAVHPLRVESVVWVAERKDVLCGVFFWLTIAAYAGYARRPFSAARYGLVLFCFALALLAKPMAVSLPLVLLLLDYWPLRRTGARPWSSLLLEKLPLAAMSLALCATTMLVQREAVQLNESIPFSARAANALLSYQAYVLRTFWPSGLAIHYPFPQQPPSLLAFAVAAALLLAITAAALALRHSRPYLIVGWLWYLITLLPVIGLVQVGRQATADRYTYLPQWGLLVMVVFCVADCRRPRLPLTAAKASATALLLAASMLASWRQTQFWRDDISLLQRALACNEADSEMHNNMAAALVDRHDFAAALPHAERAVELDPQSPSAHANLGNVLMANKRYREAVAEFQQAVRLQPNPRYRAGLQLAILGQKQAESQKP